VSNIKYLGWLVGLTAIALTAPAWAQMPSTDPSSASPSSVSPESATPGAAASESALPLSASSPSPSAPPTLITIPVADAAQSDPAASSPPSKTASKAADLRVPARATAGYDTSGAGYDGFGSFQGFIPLYQTPGKDLFYLTGRLLLDTDANLGGNLLLGYRQYNQKANRIYGAYLSYDNRDTGSNVFSQLGVGFETLGDRWDARLNAYIPLGDPRQTVSERVFTTNTQVGALQFQENFLRVSGTRSQRTVRDLEALVAGFDGEVGARLAQFPKGGDLRGYLGLYYLAAGDTSFGVRGRLQARPWDNVTLGFGVQHDGIFGTNVTASVALSFPSSRPRGADRHSVFAQMGHDPVRNYAIAIDHQQEIETTSGSFGGLLTNPSTGQPYIFQHVTLGAAGGNGTFENPFGVVQSALNGASSDGNAIVYVQAGSNPGIPAFTIPDRVQVLSTGVVQPLAASLNGQILPGFQIPLSGSGTLPTVNGTITMRSDTVLSGFNITSSTGAGITFNTVNGVEIRDNLIRNTASAGILGNGVAIATLTRNQITNAQDQGIFIQNLGTANITDNRVANTRPGTTAIANPITGDINLGSITIPNPGNIIPLPAGQGIVLSTATGNINLARNTVTGTATQGIVVLNGRGSTSITENTVTNTVGNLVSIPVAGIGTVQTPTGQGIVVAGINGNLEVNRNSVSAVNGQGIAVAGVANGTTTVTNNTVQNTVDQGLVVTGTSGTTTIANNQISTVSARAVTITVPVLGAVTIASGQGLALINSIGTVNITGNTIEQVAGVLPPPLLPGGQGIQIANFSGTVDLNLANNQIRRNDGDGILIGLAGRPSGTTTAATANVRLSGNTIENNGGASPVRGDGIAIGLEQDAVINTLLIENNTIRNNGDEGIDIRLGLQALPVVNPTTARLTGAIQNNAIANNGQNGVQVQARAGTTATIAIDRNTITNNGSIGIDLSTASFIGLGNPQLFANVRQNTITTISEPDFRAETTSSPGISQTLCVNLNANTLSRRMVFLNPFNLPNHVFSLVGTPTMVLTGNTFSPPGGSESFQGTFANVTACPSP
jgi:trimeric autotransporter adhesin